MLRDVHCSLRVLCQVANWKKARKAFFETMKAVIDSKVAERHALDYTLHTLQFACWSGATCFTQSSGVLSLLLRYCTQGQQR